MPYKNPEDKKRHNKKYWSIYRIRNQEKLKETAREYNSKPENKARANDLRKERRKKLRAELIDFYSKGKQVCACCGESQFMFLTIDHIETNAAKHKKEGLYKSSTFYEWLKKSGFPDGFQVLCYNCNCGRFRNGGVCPHLNVFRAIAPARS